MVQSVAADSFPATRQRYSYVCLTLSALDYGFLGFWGAEHTLSGLKKKKCFVKVRNNSSELRLAVAMMETKWAQDFALARGRVAQSPPVAHWCGSRGLTQAICCCTILQHVP